MRPRPLSHKGATLLASCFILVGLLAQPGYGDDPQGIGRLGRLFRFGGGGSGSVAGSNSNPHAPGNNHDDPSMAKPSPRVAPSTLYTTPAAPITPPSTPDYSSNGPAARITAQPRVSRPPTEADPIVSRISIQRADSGTQFGFFMQVFADGTVLDTEGVHRVGGDVMKPLLDAVHQGDLFRIKGHCGAPSTESIESAHVVVFDRTYGKLRATSFSYSGNPQGCDPSVRKLHAALEAIQLKLSSPASAAVPASTMTSPTQPPTPYQTGGPVLSLTPANP